MLNRFIAAAVVLASLSCLACVQAQCPLAPNAYSAGCATFTTGTLTCATCNPGFTGTTCSGGAATIPWCMTYSSSTQCGTCIPGYVLGGTITAGSGAAGTGTMVASAAGASFCYAPSSTASNAAPSLVANCAVYTAGVGSQVLSQTQCTACKTGYYLTAGVATGSGSAATCTINPTTITNCATYTSATLCATCAAGFMLGGAITAGSGLAGTGTMVASAAGASFCYTPSSTASNAAPSLVANCAVYTAGVASQVLSQTQCTTCNTGYYLTAGVATGSGSAATCVTAVSNCATYTSANVCATCNSNFYLSKTDSSMCSSCPVPAVSPASASQVQAILVAALLALLALMQ